MGYENNKFFRSFCFWQAYVRLKTENWPCLLNCITSLCLTADLHTNWTLSLSRQWANKVWGFFNIPIGSWDTQSHNNIDFALKEAEQISKLKKFIHKDNYIIENSKSANMDKHGYTKLDDSLFRLTCKLVTVNFAISAIKSA